MMPTFQLNVSHVVLLAIICAVQHWFIARAEITRPFWSRLRPGSFLDKLIRCPACSGFWLGLIAGVGGLRPVTTLSSFGAIVWSGALAVFLTPVTEAILLWGLEHSGVDDAENLTEDTATPPLPPPH